MKKSRFTLIEIFVVITIIGFILGMAVVQLDAVIPSARLKKQVRETSNVIDIAFAQAAIEGRALAIHFDRDKRLLTLEYYFSTDEQREYFLEQAEKDKLEDDEFSDEIEPLYSSHWDETISIDFIEVDISEDEDPRDFIIFNPEGMSDGATVIWKEKSGLTQEIRLWPLLGKTEILPLVNSDYH